MDVRKSSLFVLVVASVVLMSLASERPRNNQQTRTTRVIADGGSPMPPIPPQSIADGGSPMPPIPPQLITDGGSPMPPIPPQSITDGGSPMPPIPPQSTLSRVAA